MILLSDRYAKRHIEPGGMRWRPDTDMEIAMGNVRRENLNDAEFASLKEVGSGLSRTSIPEEHKKRLLELRLVKEELGTLRQTPHGLFIARPKQDPLAGMPSGRRDR